MTYLRRGLTPLPSRLRSRQELLEGGLLLPDRKERPAAEVWLQTQIQTPATGVLAEPGEVSSDVERPPELQPGHLLSQPLRRRKHRLAVLDYVEGGKHLQPRCVRFRYQSTVNSQRESCQLISQVFPTW